MLATYILLATAPLVVFCTGELPRGVPSEKAAFYSSSSKEFRCLDGSKKIPFALVNDDYCDCADGSDEPGTSACPNGKFFCRNVGHASLQIPSSRVDDHICDCCDGSDELTSGVSCPNICNELGQAAREERERQTEVARKGWTQRKELARQGQQLKSDKESSIVPARVERDQLQPRRVELEAIKKEIEDRETAAKDEHRRKWEAERDQKKRVKAEELFKTLDVDGNGKINLDDLKNNLLFDSNNDGTTDEEEAKMYLINTEEADLEQFISSMYDSIRLLIKQRRDDKKEEERREKEETDDLVAEELGKVPSQESLAGRETDDELDNLDSLEELDESQDEDKVDEPSESHHEEDDDDRMPAHSSEVQSLIDEAQKARDEWLEVDRKVSELDRQIRDVESFLEQDYGVDSAWAALRDQCFELTEMQYIYKLCPFDKTVQKDRNGHSETRLGEFASWSGTEPRKYSEQKYDKGQQCWNGPQRSTQVVIECGEENELMEATEPSKCEYRFVFKTPVACNDPDQLEPVHTEL